MIFVLFCPTLAAAEETARLVTVPACAIFDDQEETLPLLATETGYYISLSAATALGGFESVASAAGTGTAFSVGPVTRTVDLGAVDQRSYGDVTYYRLEQLTEALGVAVCIGADGRLLYNSVPAQIARLFSDTEQMLKRQADGSRAMYANALKESPVLNAFCLAMGEIYDVMTNMRVDALWGGAYNDDIAGMVRDLLKPIDDQKTVLGLISSANKSLNKVSKNLLDAQEVYEKFQEIVTDGEIPFGSDPFFFGQAGTWGLRETAKVITTVNGFDLISPKNLLEVASYATSAANASSLFVSAAVRVMAAADGAQKARYPVMTQQATAISEDYDRVLREGMAAEYASALERYVMAYIEGQAKKAATELLKETALEGIFTPVASLALAGISLIANGGWQCDDRVKAVLTGRRLDGFQDLLLEIYDAQLSGEISGENALVARDAVMLYLRCAWNAYNYYKFDSDLAGAISMAKDAVTERMEQLAAYIDGMFAEPDHTEFIFADSLAEIDPASGEIFFHGRRVPSAGERAAEEARQCYLDFLMRQDTVETEVGLEEYGLQIYPFRYYAMIDLTGDDVPELLLGSTEELYMRAFGEEITCLLVCSAEDGAVVPLWYEVIDPEIQTVRRVNGRWLRAEYIGAGGVSEERLTTLQGDAVMTLYHGWRGQAECWELNGEEISREEFARALIEIGGGADTWEEIEFFDVQTVRQTAALPTAAPAATLGTAYLTLTAPADWAERCVIEEENAGIFRVYNRLNRESGCGGLLCTVYISKRLKSNMDLLDYSLEAGLPLQNFSNSLPFFYMCDWSGGLVYAVADGTHDYNEGDPVLAADYRETYDAMGPILRTAVVHEELADVLNAVITW